MKHIFAAFTFLAFASPTSAAVFDFTDDSIFGVLDGQSGGSVEVDGIGMTVTASPTPDATIVQSEKGLGVSNEDGFWAGRQIQGDEVLLIEFDEPQVVTGFTVNSLFNWVEDELILQIEEGEFVINAGDDDEFAGEFTAIDKDGRFAFDLTAVSAASATRSISFNGKGPWSNVFDNGFTLASITTFPDTVNVDPETNPDPVLAVAEVPEPGAGVLLGAAVALIGGAFSRCERRLARV